MPKISLKMQITIGTGLLLLIFCLLSLFFLDGARNKTNHLWLHNASGYQQATFRAQQNGKPLFILIESKDCIRCRQLDDRLWRDPVLGQKLGDWQLVRLQQDADAATSQLIGSYLGKVELPIVMLERTPQEGAQPLYFNRDLDQFSLTANPQETAHPLTIDELQSALTNWLQQTHSPSQAP